MKNRMKVPFLGGVLIATAAMTSGAMAQSIKQVPVASDQAGVRSIMQQMVAIANQMQELEARKGTDPAAAALYEQLYTAYNNLSASVGGARPEAGTILNDAAGMPAKGQVNPSASPAPPTFGGEDEGGIAGAIAGCNYDFNAFSNNTAVPIPGASTAISQIAVSGVPGWLIETWVTTNVSHTWCADLTLLVTSPAGTTIRLVNQQGGSLDDLFAGTNWRDVNNSGGQVPYTFNNGIVNDYDWGTAVSGAIATLVPQDPFSVFTGEDPNGTWTLTAIDVVTADVGTINSWSLNMFTMQEPSQVIKRTFFNTTPVAIPSGPAVVSSNITVSGLGGYMQDVDVRVNITHTFGADLDVTLQAPNGDVCTLTTDNGGGFDDTFAGTIFDDSANVQSAAELLASLATYANLVAAPKLTPEESLDTFLNNPANGVWTLTISDDAAADAGSFVWGLTITTNRCGFHCPGDIDGNGVTNIDDLLGVISAWGNCP